MSCILSIYTEEHVSKEEVFNLVKKLNGQIGQIGDFSQGVIAKDDSTIWIYFRGKSVKTKVDIISELKTKFNIDANTEIAVDLGHGDYSEKLAANFCIQFLEIYPKSIVRYGEFMSKNQLKKLYDAPIINY